MKTNYLSSPFICFKYEISCVYLAKNNNNNKQKASKLWNQKLNVPLKSICWCKLQNQLWHVQSRLRRLSIFTSGMSGNLLQSLPADEAILALLTLFRKVNTRSTVIFPCWSPSRQSPLQPFFFFLCWSHLRENGADRKRMLRRLPSRLFSPFFFFLEGGLPRNAPLPSRNDAWHPKKRLQRRLNFRLHFPKMLQVVFWLVYSMDCGLWPDYWIGTNFNRSAVVRPKKRVSVYFPTQTET